MNKISAAVKKLRGNLGITQPELANRIGVSIRALANYEAGRVPAPTVLLALARLAAERDFADLARVFAEAQAAAMEGKTQPASHEEKAAVRVILCLIRNKQWIQNWPEIVNALLGALDELIVSAASTDVPGMTEIKTLEEAAILGRQYLVKESAEQKLDSIAKQRAEQTGENYHAAYAVVLLDNPELYNEYLEERAAAARGTSFESSIARGKASAKGGKK